MNHLLQDVRFAFRQLRRAPGFSLAAVLTLALGIAALTTVFTWIKAVMFDPYPHVSDPRTLRFVDATVHGGQGYSVHYDTFEALRERDRSLANPAVFTIDVVDLASQGAPPDALMAGLVSSNYFELLGVRPQLGRFFTPASNDRVYGAQDQVVLSDREWRARFNADPHIVGQAITLNRRPFTVIGVAPPQFAGIYGGLGELMWLPLSASRSLQPDPNADPLKNMGLMLAARLRPGVSDQSAASELHALARQFAQEAEAKGATMGGWDLNLRDSAHFERGMFSVIGEQWPLLLGAAVLLFLLVCINTASLLAQRSARRRREVAIRTSMGATSGRIASQLFAEALLLSVVGGVVGWAASLALSKSLYVLLPSFGFSYSFNLNTDWRVLALVLVLVVAVTLLCGMTPIRQALRTSQREGLYERGQAIVGSGRNRWVRVAMLGTQLGLCFVVLAGSALLLRTLINVLERARGFDRENVMTAQLSLTRSGYTKEKGLAFQTALLQDLRNSPVVRDATLTSHLPMGDWGSGNSWDVAIPGYTPAKNESMSIVTDLEGPDFFQTMRIPLLQGRDFTAQDRDGAPLVAVVNEDMAHRYWPKGNAVGSSVVVGPQKQACQIVGIVKNYAYHNPQNTDPDPVLYLPILQHYQGELFVAARSRTTAEAVLPALRESISKLDSALPLESVQTLRQVGEVLYQFSWIPVELLGVFALASLLVASLGLYAVMAYSVTERNREFALRMAVGATRAQIVRLVVSGGLQTVAVGLVIGAVGSFFAVKLLRSALFGVGAADPLSFAAAALMLVITVLLAGLLPARRAASVQPMQVLKTE
jgi:predicted permease